MRIITLLTAQFPYYFKQKNYRIIIFSILTFTLISCGNNGKCDYCSSSFERTDDNYGYKAGCDSELSRSIKGMMDVASELSGQKKSSWYGIKISKESALEYEGKIFCSEKCVVEYCD